MPTPSIVHLFNKFAGREVLPPTAGGIDPTLQEMKKLAEDNGLNLRVWYPNTIGTMDLRGDRINAHVQKDADGKFRVANRFNIG